MYTLLDILMMAPQEGSEGSPMPMLFMLGAVFIIIYFFMIRPQSRKAKEQKNLLSQIGKNDRIVTVGGIHGKIVSVEDDSYLVEIDQNTKIRIEKSVISLEFTKALRARIEGKAGKA